MQAAGMNVEEDMELGGGGEEESKTSASSLAAAAHASSSSTAGNTGRTSSSSSDGIDAPNFGTWGLAACVSASYGFPSLFPLLLLLA